MPCAAFASASSGKVKRIYMRTVISKSNLCMVTLVLFPVKFEEGSPQDLVINCMYMEDNLYPLPTGSWWCQLPVGMHVLPIAFVYSFIWEKGMKSVSLLLKVKLSKVQKQLYIILYQVLRPFSLLLKTGWHESHILLTINYQSLNAQSKVTQSKIT